MRTAWQFRALAVLILASAFGASLADTIVKKDGTILRGRVISKGEKDVKFEWEKFGKTVISIPLSDISSIREDGNDANTPGKPQTRPAEKPNGPQYSLVPIHGRIGTEVTAEALEQALRLVRAEKPDVVVFCFDSPGGYINEMQKIIEVLTKQRGMRRVAYVKSAISAAAIIAATCPEIYMAPDGRIGAAVPYGKDSAGIPRDVGEKFRSIYLSQCRAAAEAGGHSPLVIRGMVELELALSVVSEGGKAVVVEGNRGKPLKARGKILTLTASEATACGLANGVAKRVETLNVYLGIPEWRRATDGAWTWMAAKARAARKEAQKKEAEAARAAYMQAIAPTLAKVDAQLAEARAAGRAGEATKADLKSQYNAELAPINARYSEACRQAERSSPAARQRLKQEAAEIRDLEIARLTTRYQPQAIAVRDRINRLAELVKLLLKQRADLLKNAPR